MQFLIDSKIRGRKMKTNTKNRTFLHVCLILLLSVLMAGCSGNDEFDKLKVVDGNGRVLVLRHYMGDMYFIVIDEETPNSEINAKLVKKPSDVGR